MAYRGNAYYQPRQDTGWGLIFRLNGLLNKIERDVDEGELDNWNKHIDAIFRNILYKNDAEILYNEKGKLMDIRFTKEDIEIFSRFAVMIKTIKDKMVAVMNYEDDDEKKRQLRLLREDLYNILFKKDIWIRKKMFELELYLRQVEHDPRRAIYGG
jgi:hypothetical protein